LIAAEGLDGSGKSAGLDSLARWLERKGRRVHVVSWRPSRMVARAAAQPLGRRVLTPRVAAFLAAAEAARRIADDVRPPLVRGDIVLADRYAWTAVAREVARGLEAEWVAGLYAFAPRPDLVVFHRQDPAIALARALASRPMPTGAEAVAAAYEAFLGRLLATYERLLTEPDSGPWPVTRAVELGPDMTLDQRLSTVRGAVRPLLDRAA
jgi:thymidylate kinase